ncbi:MAG: choice-of-anchor V domain-containing protein [Bryobacteraceae bacterium]|jgi:uncharacterized protein (TIGR03437 family)
MTRRGKIAIAKTAVVLAALPVLLWAYEFGPYPGYAGVPGENGGATCATSGCHLGTANNPANKGSVTVGFPNGATYTPGVPQTLTVTITDPAQNAAGFELTARLASTPSTMAGSFAATDANTQLLCSQTNLLVAQPVPNTSPQTCPSGYTLQYIEQSLTGFNNSVGHLPYSFSFTWTPPCTNVGNVTLYVAADAGSGIPPSADSDHIYAATSTVSPVTGANTPAISCGIISAGDFGGFAAAAAGSWIEIYGTNLGPSTGYQWQGSDFSGNNAPTKLQGVSVGINGQSAFVDYVSAGQVNAQVPNGVGLGPQTVIVTTSAGSSAPYTLTVNALEPGLLAPGSFTIGGDQYVVAFNSDGSYALPTTSTLGLNSRPARPGETLVIYGVGFGPAAANGAPIPPGVVVTQQNALVDSMQMFFGGTLAALSYQGLAPGSIGLYQFNAVVPTSIANSDAVPLTFNIGGNTGSQTLYTAVHN